MGQGDGPLAQEREAVAAGLERVDDVKRRVDEIWQALAITSSSI